MTNMEHCLRWLELTKSDPAARAELEAVAADTAELTDRFYTDLSFGTAGMRGVLGMGRNRMNPYVVRRATQGLADYINASLPEASVAIGYDSRRMSAEFALETALVLCANGIRAYLFDALRPVALLSFAVRHLGCISGVVITASHNPKEYNGYKVYWQDGGQMPPDRAARVTERIYALDYDAVRTMPEEEAAACGLLRYIGQDIDEEYYKMVLGLSVSPDICREHGGQISIVYSPLNGSGNVPVRRVLARAGFTDVTVVPEQAQPDPDFTTVGVPNPENRAAYALALELAEARGADLVFATDPDCDRVGVAAKRGDGDYVLLTGNQIGCLLCDYILGGLSQAGRLPKNGAVVKSIVSTELARLIAESYGVQSFDVLTGFKFIAEKIQQFEDTGSHTFLFGFEESFGYLSGCDVRDKDGVNAALLLAECALYHKLRGCTLYQGLEAIYAKYGWAVEQVDSFTLKGADGAAQMKRAMAFLRANPPKEAGGLSVMRLRDYLAGIDGFPASDVLYYELGGGTWACVRPSGTEPKIKLYVNAIEQSREAAESRASAIRADIGRLLDAAFRA